MGKKKSAPEEAPPAPEPPAADNKKSEDEEEDTPAVKAMKEIDLRYCAIETEFEHEVEKLRQKIYKERQAPLIEERTKVLADTSNAPAEDHKFGTPACKGFWLQALQNEEELAELFEAWDEPVLEYLDDIRVKDLDEAVPQQGFRVDFAFKENEWFTNDNLWVEFHADYDAASHKPWKELPQKEMKASPIEWKSGKNVTVELVQKKTKGGGAKKAKQKAKAAKEEPRASFFRHVFRNLKVGDPIPEDMNEELDQYKAMKLSQTGMEASDSECIEMVLSQWVGIGQCLKQGVIPFAVRFYTGEAGDIESDDDEESESEEDDDDESDEDDSEDEPRGRKGGGKGAKKKAGPGNKPAGGEGKKEEECKQQ